MRPHTKNNEELSRKNDAPQSRHIFVLCHLRLPQAKEKRDERGNCLRYSY